MKRSEWGAAAAFIVIVTGVCLWRILGATDGPRAAIAPPSPPDPLEEIRAKVKVVPKWWAGGLGNVAMADLTVTNGNELTVRDVEIACEAFAKSGARLGALRYTVHDVVPAGGSIVAQQASLGLIDQQTESLRCGVVGVRR